MKEVFLCPACKYKEVREFEDENHITACPKCSATGYSLRGDETVISNMLGTFQKISDAELIALAALAKIEAVLMDGDNHAKILFGECPLWTVGGGYLEAGTELREELWRRGILKNG